MFGHTPSTVTGMLDRLKELEAGIFAAVWSLDREGFEAVMRVAGDITRVDPKRGEER